MLKYLGLDNYANLISDSLFIALTERHMHTADIGGRLTVPAWDSGIKIFMSFSVQI